MVLVAKRIEHVPNSDPPRVVLKSLNPDYDSYERLAEEGPPRRPRRVGLQAAVGLRGGGYTGPLQSRGSCPGAISPPAVTNLSVLSVAPKSPSLGTLVPEQLLDSLDQARPSRAVKLDEPRL